MLSKEMQKRLFDINEINEPMKLIDGSITDYITSSGKVYKYYNGLYLLKKSKPNKVNKYVYIGITMANGKNKSFRVHRLVAKAFIDNPNNYNIVGHKNNIKHDNRVENLYWTTTSENTKKAFDDGLAINAKGIYDSQSKKVVAYKNGVVIGEYGSLKECARILKIPLTTIIRRCDKKVDSKVYRKYKEYDFNYK